jgi:hypothetical protein
MRWTQSLLEALVHGKTTGDVRATQTAIEVADQNPAAVDVKNTQAAIEVLESRPATVTVTQMCIEVAWPRIAPEVPPVVPPTPEPDVVPQTLLVCDLNRGRWFQDSRGYMSLCAEGPDRPLLGGDLQGGVESVEGDL